ncbi:MAG: glycoside hydrolase 43 family protein [Balneolaceae bacterium]
MCFLSAYLFLYLALISGGRLYAQITQYSPRNPVIWADVPDPSVILVDDIYYMSSTTMHMNPGVPIMKSKDLVNWEIVNYVYNILGKTDQHALINGENEYGRGSWASSLRYHNGYFYLATFSNSTQHTYVFRTEDIEKGSWEQFVLNGWYHDPSLFFDGGRAFLVYGVDDIRIIELTAKATAVKEDGVDQILIPNSKDIAGNEFYVPAEGSHIQEINGTYYVSLISWPIGKGRTQVVYRSDSLFGKYSGKVVLEDQGVAQGGLIETPEGDWYGFLFKDQGAVGRVPMLVPVKWENNWPVFGVDSKVPQQLNIEAEDSGISGIVASDEFDSATAPDSYNDETSILEGLPLVWQWNHVPNPKYWSLSERPGFLRLKNGRIDSNFTQTQNTLTQRTFGPQSTGKILLDISKMKDGDYAGLGALQGTYGTVGVRKEGAQHYVTMVMGSPDSVEEKEKYPITQDSVHLSIAFDYKNLSDKAHFYYSLDGKNWKQIGDALQMQYTLDHFVGYRFALYNYATKEAGGYVDFDYFRVEPGLLKNLE